MKLNLFKYRKKMQNNNIYTKKAKLMEMVLFDRGFIHYSFTKSGQQIER